MSSPGKTLPIRQSNIDLLLSTYVIHPQDYSVFSPNSSFYMITRNADLVPAFPVLHPKQVLINYSTDWSSCPTLCPSNFHSRKIFYPFSYGLHHSTHIHIMLFLLLSYVNWFLSSWVFYIPLSHYLIHIRIDKYLLNLEEVLFVVNFDVIGNVTF